MLSLESIYESLRNCVCDYKEGPRPFFFEPSPLIKKKVMLITLCPTYQAVYRPLVSTRFFRTLCLALYGSKPQPSSGNLQYNFMQSIYWTHYHKCYIKDAVENYESIPPYCMDKYLEKEVIAVDPSLILVLGKPVSTLLSNRGKLKNNTLFGHHCIRADFPVTGAEEEFVSIRKELVRHGVSGIDTNPVPLELISKINYHAGEVAVHADFEFEGLLKYYDLIKFIKSINSNNVDGMWHNQELIPRYIKYSFVSFCYAFMEDQIKTVLLGRNYKFSREESPRVHEFLNTLINEKEHKEELRYKYGTLTDDLKNFNEVRGCIVHCGGRVNDNKRLNRIKGIDNVYGYLEINDEGYSTILEVVKRFNMALIDIAAIPDDKS
jgi:hypothetical protein